MAGSLNRAQIMGNVGADPEIKTTQAGKKFATFRLATSEKWKDASGQPKEVTEWHSITVWNEHLVAIVEQYVKKGSRLYLEGKIEYREYRKDSDPPDEKRYATSIVLNPFGSMLQLLDRAPSNGQRPPDPTEPKRDFARPPSNGNGAAPSKNYSMDDEIPFRHEDR